jgi:hypothetical protein
VQSFKGAANQVTVALFDEMDPLSKLTVGANALNGSVLIASVTTFHWLLRLALEQATLTRNLMLVFVGKSVAVHPVAHKFVRLEHPGTTYQESPISSFL